MNPKNHSRLFEDGSLEPLLLQEVLFSSSRIGFGGITLQELAVAGKVLVPRTRGVGRVYLVIKA